MSMQALIDAFDTWKSRGQDLVLATVLATEGSTYAKAGHQMLLTPSGDYAGLLSGGCLEGDLAERGRAMLTAGATQVTYDMRDQDEDALWGLGLGCNGLMRVLLQPLTADQGYQPFAAIAAHARERTPGVVILATTAGKTPIQPGAAAVYAGGEMDSYNVHGHTAEWRDLAEEATAARAAAHVVAWREHELLIAPLAHDPHVLVLGAGPDAVPLVELGERLGWQITVADHRPGYVERLRSATGATVHQVEPADLDASLDSDSFDAAVIMSHHLVTDLNYLRALAHWPTPYVGSLGPPARRDKLLEDLGEDAKRLRGRLFGPVGLDLAAHDPETIALAILAEIQAALAGRPGGHLGAFR
jgi:xanthine/CO dehydrogenase XdhC/CoxF family maturation factor